MSCGIKRQSAIEDDGRQLAKTINLYRVKHHYYENHPTINPSCIVPLGSIIDFAMPTRDSVDAARTR